MNYSIENIVKYIDIDNTKLIKVAGSVAVGKSTFADELKNGLLSSNKNLVIQVISTDHFLYPNSIIEQKCGMNKKGFVPSYNMQLLNNFLSAHINMTIKPKVFTYSHFNYDIDLNKPLAVDDADIIIVEGVVALDSSLIPADVGIFLSASYKSLFHWYLHRFLDLCNQASQTNSGYFIKFINYSKSDLAALAQQVWDEVNWVNYQENILATKQNADIIITKNIDHTFSKIIKQVNK